MYDEAFQEGVTADKNGILLYKLKAGDKDALELIVTENSALVKSIVRHFLNRGCEYDDLVQLGTIGLIKAARNYDFSFDVKFSTYAVPLIAGEIKRFLRDDGAIKISRTIKETARNIAREKELLFAKLGREASVGEIAEALGISREETVEAMEALSPIESIYSPVSESEGNELQLIDRLPSDGDTEKEIGDRVLLKELLDSLDEEERKIIVLRYYRGLTQTEVANMLGITQVQVSRKEKRILTNFRRQCG